MECKRCLLTTDITDVVLDHNGVCNFCAHHDKIELASKGFDFDAFVDKLKQQKGKYHCLIPISGGLDSSILLHLMVTRYGLNPLVIHMDNYWNTDAANHNIYTMVQKLGVDFIRYQISEYELNAINKSFLKASVSEADIPNDMAMVEYFRLACKQYNIKWVLNGHDFRGEGTTPLSWTYMDSKYIESVHARHNGTTLKSFPLMTLGRQFMYAFNRIKHISPLYYIPYDRASVKEELIRTYGWKDYGMKHQENDYTWFVGAYLLPNKFGIDKRLLYLSARVRSGELSKEEARILLQEEVPVPKKIITEIKKRQGWNTADWNAMMSLSRHTHYEYETYHPFFKKYRWLMWVMMKLDAVSYNFYKKYCF
jgi:hypothetical protein